MTKRSFSVLAGVIFFVSCSYDFSEPELKNIESVRSHGGQIKGSLTLNYSNDTIKRFYVKLEPAKLYINRVPVGKTYMKEEVRINRKDETEIPVFFEIDEKKATGAVINQILFNMPVTLRFSGTLKLRRLWITRETPIDKTFTFSARELKQKFLK